MRPRVVYVQASEAEPNTSAIEGICLEMAEHGLALNHVSASQGEGGVTAGLWLFFSEIVEASSVADDSRAQGWFATPILMQVPSIWKEFRARKGLGASLTLTGVVSLALGIIIHFALRHNLIDTTLHLGYFFGLVGLFLLLIGLVIVF